MKKEHIGGQSEVRTKEQKNFQKKKEQINDGEWKNFGKPEREREQAGRIGMSTKVEQTRRRKHGLTKNGEKGSRKKSVLAGLTETK